MTKWLLPTLCWKGHRKASGLRPKKRRQWRLVDKAVREDLLALLRTGGAPTAPDVLEDALDTSQLLQEYPRFLASQPGLTPEQFAFMFARAMEREAHVQDYFRLLEAVMDYERITGLQENPASRS